VTSHTVDVQTTFDCGYDLEPRDGKLYMKLKDAVCTSTPSRIYIHLTNLFNGNELLGKFFKKANILRFHAGEYIYIGILGWNVV
jgi:hypothetical protein